MEATKEQKQAIYRLSEYRKDIKEEWVQWATNDTAKISTNDLSFDQANQIIEKAGGTPYSKKGKGDNWAYFDKNDGQHKYILSLCRQLNWTTSHAKFGQVVDLVRLSEWLKSRKSPVKKKLKDMDEKECSRIIAALEKMTEKRYR